jgi:sporulation protein YlmC with PRC-barrel domain
MRANEMLGTVVRARSGEELGALQDLVFDAQLRTVKSAVIGRRGVLGAAAGRTLEVPLRSLMLDTENECFVVDAVPDEATPH